MWPPRPLPAAFAVLVMLSLAAGPDSKGSHFDTGCNATLTADGREGRIIFFLGRNVTMPMTELFGHLRLNKDNADILRCHKKKTASSIECNVLNHMYRSDGIINSTLSVNILNVKTETRGTYFWQMSINDSWVDVIPCNFTQRIKVENKDKDNTLVAAIVVPVLIILFIVVVYILVYRFLKKRNANRMQAETPSLSEQTPENGFMLQDNSCRRWFFGTMSKETAETLLLSEENEDGSFLIRIAGQRRDKYVLSLRFMGETPHYVVNNDNNAHWIDEGTKVPGTLQDLVDHYTENQGCLPHQLFIPCKCPEQKASRKCCC